MGLQLRCQAMSSSIEPSFTQFAKMVEDLEKVWYVPLVIRDRNQMNL